MADPTRHRVKGWVWHIPPAIGCRPCCIIQDSGCKSCCIIHGSKSSPPPTTTPQTPPLTTQAQGPAKSLHVKLHRSLSLFMSIFHLSIKTNPIISLSVCLSVSLRPPSLLTITLPPCLPSPLLPPSLLLPLSPHLLPRAKGRETNEPVQG